uniref:Polyprotein n=1 Tax=Rocky Mountain woodsia associated virus TaxID=2933185 RepID=A0A9C7GX63_9VIRU|nr:polyprotein [Rocky Mountain woodsia associated virus]
MHDDSSSSCTRGPFTRPHPCCLPRAACAPVCCSFCFSSDCSGCESGADCTSFCSAPVSDCYLSDCKVSSFSSADYCEYPIVDFESSPSFLEASTPSVFGLSGSASPELSSSSGPPRKRRPGHRRGRRLARRSSKCSCSGSSVDCGSSGGSCGVSPSPTPAPVVDPSPVFVEGFKLYDQRRFLLDADDERNRFVNACVSLQGESIEVQKLVEEIETPFLVKIGAKLKSFVQSFALTLKFISYITASFPIKLPNTTPTRYPVDSFVERVLSMINPDFLAIAKSTYRRVNPTTILRLNALKKFDKGELDHKLEERIICKFIDLADEVAPWHDLQFVSELNVQLSDPDDYADIEFNGSSAAGYPFRVGTKRREAHRQACDMACEIFHDYDDSFFREHVWYTTGRAKMVEHASPDSARLICYQSMALFMLASKYAQPFTNFFVKRGPSWSAVGMSWFHRGAEKLMSFFGCVKGFAQRGHKMFSLDVSGWDADMRGAYIKGLKAFHLRVLHQSYSGRNLQRWEKVVSNLYDDMLEAKVLFPGGHLFKTTHGMKSGWVMTAIDNTIAHEVVMRLVFEEKFQSAPPDHKLYGDDNIFSAVEELDHTKVIEGYLDLGFIVKHVHHSKLTREVDFLSKFCIWDEECHEWFPWRPTVETASRLYMPEDYDPTFVNALDQVAAAERALGHLFDNFFNAPVREACYALLTLIRDKYKVTEVDIQRALKKFKFQGLLAEGLRTTVPTVPEPRIILGLYESNMNLSAPLQIANSTIFLEHKYDSHVYADNCVVGADAEHSADRVEVWLRNNLSLKNRNRVDKHLRYFKPPFVCAGNAGARILECLKVLNVNSVSRIIDVGSHPGSSPVSLRNKFPNAHICCVSVIPEIDVSNGLIPFYKVINRENMEFHAKSFRDFAVIGDVDLVVHDVSDVDIRVNSFTSLDKKKVNEYHMAAQTFWKVRKHTRHVVIRLPHLSGDVVRLLHEIYLWAGRFDIVKPIFSSPWSQQVYVVATRGVCSSPMPLGRFGQSIYAFRNSCAMRLRVWCNDRLMSGVNVHRGEGFFRNPLLDDDEFQSSLAIQAFDSHFCFS